MSSPGRDLPGHLTPELNRQIAFRYARPIVRPDQQPPVVGRIALFYDDVEPARSGRRSG
jgi:hypothetical protein